MQAELPGLSVHTALTCNGWYVSSPDPEADKTHQMCRDCARKLPIGAEQDGDIEPDGDGIRCPQKLPLNTQIAGPKGPAHR